MWSYLLVIIHRCRFDIVSRTHQDEGSDTEQEKESGLWWNLKSGILHVQCRHFYSTILIFITWFIVNNLKVTLCGVCNPIGKSVCVCVFWIEVHGLFCNWNKRQRDGWRDWWMKEWELSCTQDDVNTGVSKHRTAHVSDLQRKRGFFKRLLHLTC